MPEITRLGLLCSHDHRPGVCHVRSASESSYYTPAFTTKVGAVILDNIDAQNLVSGLEEKFAHAGAEANACRSGGTPAAGRVTWWASATGENI
eukprot:16427740-Heterocapsa_arctica.AAC.1